MKVELGDAVYKIIVSEKDRIYQVGEDIQLAYFAFSNQAVWIKNGKEEKIKFKFPVGQKADRTHILSEKEYTKDQFFDKYKELAEYGLMVDGVYQLVTIVESMFLRLLSEILTAYPKKIGGKKSISISEVLECESIDAVHKKVLSGFLNELAYKSPKDFAESVSDIFSFNLLEIPYFHGYIEVKATRDIFIHNNGVINESYLRKSASHARGKEGEGYEMNTVYFMDSLEFCFKLVEEMVSQFHKVWHSPLYEEELKRIAILRKNIAKG